MVFIHKKRNITSTACPIEPQERKKFRWHSHEYMMGEGKERWYKVEKEEGGGGGEGGGGEGGGGEGEGRGGGGGGGGGSIGVGR